MMLVWNIASAASFWTQPSTFIHVQAISSIEILYTKDTDKFA